MDLSSWQGDISQATWNNIKNVQGKQFGFVRASRGATFGPVVPPTENDGNPYNRYDDRFFVNNITRGTAAGLLMGSYHYNRADITGNTGADEANHYMETGTQQPAGLSPQYAGNFMRPGYLLPVFDLEAGQNLDTPTLTAWANEFIQTIYNAKGFYPIVYTNSNYNNDQVSASVAWFNVDTGAGPHTGLKTYQWLARPLGDIVNGDPGASTSGSGYPNPYGSWDANFNTRTNSRDPAINPWAFWQNGTFVIDGGANGSGDKDAANGNIEYVKDFLVPALWTNSGSGDWSTMANWNSNNPLYNSSDPSFGPASRLPNSTDWVQLRNSGGGTITHSTGAHTIRKLTTQQPLSITGGSLTIGYVPGSGGREDIPAEFTASVTISTGASYTAHTTQVDGGGGVFNVNGGVITFNTINLASHASNAGKIVIGGNPTYAPYGGSGTAIIRSTGELAQAGTVDLGASQRTLNISDGSSAVDVSIQAVVIGTGGLLKSGNGSLQLAATNTYTGGTTVNVGAMRITKDTNLGDAPGSFQAANLTLNNNTILQTGAEITALTLTNAGTGYSSFPTLAITGAGADNVPASGNVLASLGSIAVTAGGSNYINQTSAPSAGGVGTFVDIVGGGGTGATAYATVVGGVVTAVTITNAGSSYTSMPTIHISSTVSAGSAAGSGAAANVSGITLTSLLLGDKGFDYTAPTVTLTGGGGTGATGSATTTASFATATNRGLTLGGTGGTLYQAGSSTLTWASVITGPSGAALTKSGTGTLALAGDNTYSGPTIINAGVLSASNSGNLGDASPTNIVTFNGGTLRIFGLGSSARNVTVNAGGGTIETPLASTFGNVTGAGNLTKIGAGFLTINYAQVGALAVNVGTMTIAHSAGTPPAAPAVSTLTSLTVAASAKLDMTNSKLIVKTTAAAGSWNGTAYTGLHALLKTGYNNGGWNGNGLNTSESLASAGVTGIAVATAGEVNKTTFGGFAVASTWTLGMYTYAGDANLSGYVDADDYFQIDSHYHTSNNAQINYHNGDFNYNGTIDSDDYGVIDAGYTGQSAPFSSAAPLGGVSSVPEPTMLCLPLAVFASRRRRRASPISR